MTYRPLEFYHSRPQFNTENVSAQSCLGGYISKDKIETVTCSRVDSLRNVSIIYCSSNIDAGVGQLSIMGTLIKFRAPNDNYGEIIPINYNKPMTVYSENKQMFITILIRDNAVSGEEILQFKKKYFTPVAPYESICLTDSTDITYSGIFIKNVSENNIDIKQCSISNWLEVGFEIPVNNTIQLIPDCTTEPTEIAFLDSTILSQITFDDFTLEPNQYVGIWLKQIFDEICTPNKYAYLSFNIDTTINNEFIQLTPKIETISRRGNDSSSGWLIDMTTDNTSMQFFENGSFLEKIIPLEDEINYNFITRKVNKYGLISLNTDIYKFKSYSDSTNIIYKPSKPTLRMTTSVDDQEPGNDQFMRYPSFSLYGTYYSMFDTDNNRERATMWEVGYAFGDETSQTSVYIPMQNQNIDNISYSNIYDEEIDEIPVYLSLRTYVDKTSSFCFSDSVNDNRTIKLYPNQIGIFNRFINSNYSKSSEFDENEYFNAIYEDINGITKQPVRYDPGYTDSSNEHQRLYFEKYGDKILVRKTEPIIGEDTTSKLNQTIMVLTEDKIITSYTVKHGTMSTTPVYSQFIEWVTVDTDTPRFRFNLNDDHVLEVDTESRIIYSNKIIKEKYIEQTNAPKYFWPCFRRIVFNQYNKTYQKWLSLMELKSDVVRTQVPIYHVKQYMELEY